MMSELASLLEQARLFAVEHIPAEAVDRAIPVAAICLAIGIGMCVLGAKLARFGLGLAFGVVGVVLGAYFGDLSGFPKPICAAGGAVMVAIIGYQTYRLWVGLAAAVVFSSFALGAFGYQRVIPHVAEFEHVKTWTPTDGATSFSVPSPEEQQAYVDPAPGEWLKEFWAFVTQKDAGVERGGRSLGIAAMITGLCLGVLAVRWALILSTSLIGTALVVTGGATLASHIWPQASYQALQAHPGVVGMAVGGFLVSSLILQTMLTKGASRGKGEAAPKS